MTMRATRRFGALALLAVGAVHLQQYLGNGYSSTPTIGPLFLLNAIGSGLVGFGLLSPIERALPGRRADLSAGLLAVMGAVIAAGSLIALFISENGTLFGFSEDGYSTAVVIAIATEVASVALLTPVAVGSIVQAMSRGPAPRSTGALSSR